MIWNTVECVGLYHLIIEHRIFVSVVQRNHNAAFQFAELRAVVKIF